MKKSYILGRTCSIIVPILFILGLSFIYPFTVRTFNGDSNQYFSWIKDIYTHHGGYFSWTTAPGYNQFSLVHLFSFVIGGISYKLPTIFFLIVNYTELILLWFAPILFVKLTACKSAEDQSVHKWFYGLPLCIVIWTLLCLFSGTASQSLQLQATDLFLIFIDSFIIISIAWFLFLLNKIYTEKKVTWQEIAYFILFQLYFALTTLRFLSGAILTEMLLFGCLTIRSIWCTRITSKKSKKNQRRTWQQESDAIDRFILDYKQRKTLAILLGLMVIFLVGYYGFFMIEPYSSSARFVLRGGELGTMQAFNNATLALVQYFSFANLNGIIILLRLIYLVTLGYGFICLCVILLPNKPKIQKLTSMRLFAILTVINFILVTASGLFSHGTVFLDVAVIAHYYELSGIFSFLTVVAFIIDKCNFTVRQIRLVALSGLLISTLFSIVYIKLNSLMQFPDAQLLACINHNKDQFHLKNGMGEFWTISPIMAEADSNMRFSVIGSRATNLDYNWQSNMTELIANNNFLIYGDERYKQNALGLISSKIPSLNYQDIDCGDDSGIVVFDAKTTKYIDQFRKVEFNNSKSWFFISSYGLGQELWGMMPWNQQFIHKYHQYFYYGTLLHRVSPQAEYTPNDDLSVQVNGENLSTAQPILMTDMIHAGSGSYSVDVHYQVANGNAMVFMVNLLTKQAIANLLLDQTASYSTIDFDLPNATPMAIVIVLSPRAKLLFKELTLAKDM